MGLAGRDLIGVAETGSGKTAAFLIPLLTYILSQPRAVRDKVRGDRRGSAVGEGLLARFIYFCNDTSTPHLCTYFMRFCVRQVAESGPLALIMAPTRELAQQIDAEAVKIAKYTDVRSCCVVGGVSITEQGVKLRSVSETLSLV